MLERILSIDDKELYLLIAGYAFQKIKAFLGHCGLDSVDRDGRRL
ncbi:hypothetical protein [Commensalibacter communis]|nr:hypothetical protein [Commensalibacter communis]